jgi:folate-dependent phosphoribosylglycinamide formyltransferase PurN
MKSVPKIIIITSNQLRHKYFASELCKSLDLAGIVAEEKSAGINAVQNLDPGDQAVINRHFKLRDEAEHKWFGDDINWPNTEIINIQNNQVNDLWVSDWIVNKNPDIILLYGSGIIKDPLLSLFSGKIINLHLGLSPYYRGSGTNLWPLVYSEPECVGATIHLAVNKVDAGSILHQVRPDLSETDSVHDLGTKTIEKAVRQLPVIVNGYVSGRLVAEQQNLSIGKVFTIKQFNADSVRKMMYNFDRGMIPEYMAHFEIRNLNFPIINNIAEV